MAPADEASALIVVKVWIEQTLRAPFRARVTTRPNLVEPQEESEVVFDPDDVIGAVEKFLREFLNGAASAPKGFSGPSTVATRNDDVT